MLTALLAVTGILGARALITAILEGATVARFIVAGVVQSADIAIVTGRYIGVVHATSLGITGVVCTFIVVITDQRLAGTTLGRSTDIVDGTYIVIVTRGLIVVVDATL